MILIITLNPILERRFSLAQIRQGEVNRDCKLELCAGGKGINVSRQLKKFGINSFNFLFTGGNSGKIYKEILKKEGLDFAFVPAFSGTREAAVFISENDRSISSCFSHDPEITASEAEEFKVRLEKMIRNCEIVIFSGSSPSESANSIIPYGIRLANKYDKISICDTYGAHLPESLDESPTIVHNNIREIEKSLSVKLDTEEAVVRFIRELYAKNIKRTYLTNGPESFFASNFDYIYKVQPLKVDSIDPTGSGDCFVASLAYSWSGSDVFEDSLKLAAAAAGLNAASFKVCDVGIEDAMQMKEFVKIHPVGKKMKIIDDSPHEI